VPPDSLVGDARAIYYLGQSTASSQSTACIGAYSETVHERPAEPVDTIAVVRLHDAEAPSEHSTDPDIACKFAAAKF